MRKSRAVMNLFLESRPQMVRVGSAWYCSTYLCNFLPQIWLSIHLAEGCLRYPGSFLSSVHTETMSFVLWQWQVKDGLGEDSGPLESRTARSRKIPKAPWCKQLEQSVTPLNLSVNGPAPLPIGIMHTMLLDQKGEDQAILYPAETWGYRGNQLLLKNQL